MPKISVSIYFVFRSCVPWPFLLSSIAPRGWERKNTVNTPRCHRCLHIHNSPFVPSGALSAGVGGGTWYWRRSLLYWIFALNLFLLYWFFLLNLLLLYCELALTVLVFLTELILLSCYFLLTSFLLTVLPFLSKRVLTVLLFLTKLVLTRLLFLTVLL